MRLKTSRDVGAAIVAATPLIIGLATFAAFVPALWNGFVDWDDNVNLLTNPHYRGLGWANLRWMSTATIFAHWMPITWLTYGLDYLVWGMNPVGYHLTSMILHAVNAALAFWVALALLGHAAPALKPRMLALGAAVAALFFALHPLRVESVVWISARRDLVSGFWTFLCVLAYVRMAETAPSRRVRWLAISAACYALAITSKSMVMTLPILLLVMDVWPLRRMPGRLRDWLDERHRRVLFEKIPFAALALIGAAVALVSILNGGYLTSLAAQSMTARVGMLGYALAFYARKTVVPSGLAVLHELPARVSLLEPAFFVSVLAVIAITVITWRLRRRWPALLAAWVAYVTVLMPMSGPVHAGHQIVADRYSYLSCFPWALLVGGGVAMIASARRRRVAARAARVAVGAMAVWLVGLGVLTWSETQAWYDTETVWRYALLADPDCALCHSQLGADLGNRGLLEPAREEFARAVALRPDEPGLRGNLGLALLRLNRLDEAIGEFRTALARQPENVELRNRLASALMRQGKVGPAVAELREALRIDKNHAETLANLAVATHALGLPEKARGYLQRAVALEPASTARLNPGFVGALLGSSGSAPSSR